MVTQQIPKALQKKPRYIDVFLMEFETDSSNLDRDLSKPDRDLFAVLDELIKGVPANSPLYIKLQSIFANMNVDAAFAAPECLGVWWEQVAEAFNQNIQLPFTEEWQYTVSALFLNLSVEDFKHILKKYPKCN